MIKDNELSNGTHETIRYDHAAHPATVTGAKAVLSMAFHLRVPESLLDIGCGTATWMRAAVDLGVRDVFGIDGIEVEPELLHVDRARIDRFDLSKPFDLGRRFEIALCLEVAEHLPENSSNDLIRSLAGHSNSILFSAACPDQPGQYHINCQWPSYWQGKFNRVGFVCDDSIRWRIWSDARIEPWYRQNIFWARRDPENAGREPRLKSSIHPDLYHDMLDVARLNFANEIASGIMPVTWYLTIPPVAAAAKLRRFILRQRGSL